MVLQEATADQPKKSAKPMPKTSACHPFSSEHSHTIPPQKYIARITLKWSGGCSASAGAASSCNQSLTYMEALQAPGKQQQQQQLGHNKHAELVQYWY
jgi:hypothetical protein